MTPNEKESAPVAPGAPSTVIAKECCTDSVSPDRAKVNDCFRLSEVRTLSGVQAKELTTVVRDRFPGFTRQIFSQCEHYEKYGCIPHPDVIPTICQAYGIQLPEAPPAKPKAKPSKRKLSRRITLRMTETDYKWLQSQIKTDDYPTMQSWFYAKIKKWRKDECSKSQTTP